MKFNTSLEKHNTLILLPHYDDEVFLFPLLRKLNENKMETHILWLTQSGGMKKKHKKTLIEKRKNESENFLVKTSLTRITTHHLGLLLAIPDGELYLGINNVEKYIKEKFSGRQWNLFTPHWENGHCDHDMSFLLGKKLESLGFGNHFSFPMYNTQSRFKPFNVMKLNGKEVKITLKMNNYDRLIFLLTPLFFMSQMKSWVGLYIPLVLRNLVRRNIHFFEGKKMEQIKFTNMRLIIKRAKAETDSFTQKVYQYCAANNIPIN